MVPPKKSLDMWMDRVYGILMVLGTIKPAVVILERK
jgi:hypothetical protein